MSDNIRMNILGNDVTLRQSVTTGEDSKTVVRYVTVQADGSVGKRSIVRRVTAGFAHTLEGQTFTVNGQTSAPIVHRTQWVEGSKGKKPANLDEYADRFYGDLDTVVNGENVRITVLAIREKGSAGLCDDYMFSIEAKELADGSGAGRVKAEAVDNPFALFG